MWKLLYSNRGPLSPQLWLRGTLSNGQVFGFSCSNVQFEGGISEEWVGVVRGKILKLRQEPFNTNQPDLPPVYFWCSSDQTEGDQRLLLDSFFRTTIDLACLYQQWSKACPRFHKLAAAFRGVRLLDQEPVECLISFICSTNNHIPRITQMLSRLRKQYGRAIDGNDAFKAFPQVEDLVTSASEEALRSMGFGYRAKYLVETARLLAARLKEDPEYFSTLRDPTVPDEKVRAELTCFAGVGPKVADCVALFSCNRLSIVPVDVHVLTMARRDYDHEGKLASMKSLNKSGYTLVSQLFATRFGAYAGWAHSVLFTGELTQFQDRLCQDLLMEAKQFRSSKGTMTGVVKPDETSKSQSSTVRKRRKKLS